MPIDRSNGALLARLMPKCWMMNSSNPLAPRFTTPPRGQSRIYFNVLMILAIQALLIGGLLLQGCKVAREQSNAGSATNSADIGYADATNANW